MPFIFVSLFLVVLLGLGIGTIVWAVLVHRAIRESCDWPSTTGLIESASVFDDYAWEAYAIRVIYGYAVAGESYRAKRIQFGENTRYRTRKEAEQVFNLSFKPGSEVRVFYSPTQPARSILRHNVKSSPVLMTLVGSFLIVVGALCLYSAWTR